MKFDPTGHYCTPHPSYWGVYLHYRTDSKGPNFSTQATVYTATPHIASVQLRLSSHEGEVQADLTREDVRELRKFLQRVEKQLAEKEGEE